MPLPCLRRYPRTSWERTHPVTSMAGTVTKGSDIIIIAAVNVYVTADPSREPALARATPADAVPRSTITERSATRPGGSVFGRQGYEQASAWWNGSSAA
jgi:hypothetical protein